MRSSRDEYDKDDVLKNGFDYDLQVWVKDYFIQNCGHKEIVNSCDCNGRKYAGWAIDLAREKEGFKKSKKKGGE
jgi:hypothetical protein